MSPRFNIQRHDASTEHYDFRLEAAGKLKSWVIPKGPSTDPSERRLAMRTFDHELGYEGFEGTIEEGYGEGTVMLWDAGEWKNLTTGDDGEEVAPADAIDGGHLKFRLDGEKIRGGYSLQRIESADDPEDERWLLIKADDEDADARRNPVSSEPDSVESGRTLEEIRKQEGEGDEGG